MSNDDTQNMVYLKIDIFNKNIVGIGKSTNTIDVVSIPIKLDNDDGIQKLQEYLQTTTAKIIPSNMSIETFGNNDLVKKTEAGQKIAILIKKLTIDNVDFASGLTELNGLTQQVDNEYGEDGNTLVGGAMIEPNTPLGKEIYSKWTARYRKQHLPRMRDALTPIHNDRKNEMRDYIDDLTTQLDDQVAAIEATPATETETAPATETETAPATATATDAATDAYMNQLDGGKHTKHTKRNKRNKHRKTKRRQSRNT